MHTKIGGGATPNESFPSAASLAASSPALSLAFCAPSEGPGLG